jgi:Uma2 family endonuclease
MGASVETEYPTQRRSNAKVLTIQDFESRHLGERVEVIDGDLVELPTPGFEHGTICFRFSRRLGGWIEDEDLGHVATHDSFVQLRADPLLIRGPDFLFISFARQPRGDKPKGVLRVAPELVAETRSPSDSWNEMLLKAAQYHAAGVQVVVLIDPPTSSITVLKADGSNQVFGPQMDFQLPEFPGFSLPVAKLFT